MLKHYVEYLHTGIFTSKTSVCEIPERDVSKIDISDNCFGFRFFDRTETVVDGELLTGDRKNISGWYYCGEKITIEQLKTTFENDSKYRILISNMECNGVRNVVRSKFGQFIPLNDGDEII